MLVHAELVKLADVRVTRVLDTALDISFVVANEHRDPIFVTFPLQEYDNVGAHPAEDKIYVFLRGSLLAFGLFAWEIPENIDVYRPEVPLLTKVDGNSEIRKTIAIKRKMKLRYPYIEQDHSGGVVEAPRSFNAATFEVGYIPIEAIADRAAALAAPNGSRLQVSYGVLSRAQKIISRRLSLPAPVVIEP
jgi:hypothetical protein